MFGEDVSAGESRAISHQPEKDILSIRTNEGHVRQIYNWLAVLKVLHGVPPGSFDLGGPRGNQLAFQHQLALTVRFND